MLEKLTDHSFSPYVLIEADISSHIDACLASLGDFKNILMVADKHTYQALVVLLNLKRDVEKHIFPSPLKAELAKAKELATLAQHHDLILAVGSGTINDLCKYASAQLNIPYLSLPTAASMNGYASANASLIKGGMKTTFKAKPPLAILCDLNVLANAPKRMIAAGVGDMICRSTVQADWLLSHYLCGTDYSDEPFELIKQHEETLYADVNRLLNKDHKAMQLQMEMLILSGIGMTLMEGSYPASQGEHTIVHCYEALSDKEYDNLHGEDIAVTTLIMAQLQEEILALEEMSYQRSYPDDFTLKVLPEILSQEKWDGIKNKIQQVKIKASSIKLILDAIHAPTYYSDLGWDKDTLKAAILEAPLSRDRFTFLDIAYLTGRLNGFTDRVD
jgi:glycerol-1-phosphate dehydrogenase [NAD(P)+]